MVDNIFDNFICIHFSILILKTIWISMPTLWNHFLCTEGMTFTFHSATCCRTNSFAWWVQKVNKFYDTSMYTLCTLQAATDSITTDQPTVLRCLLSKCLCDLGLIWFSLFIYLFNYIFPVFVSFLIFSQSLSFFLNISNSPFFFLFSFFLSILYFLFFLSFLLFYHSLFLNIPTLSFFLSFYIFPTLFLVIFSFFLS